MKYHIVKKVLKPAMKDLTSLVDLLLLMFGKMDVLLNPLFLNIILLKLLSCYIEEDFNRAAPMTDLHYTRNEAFHYGFSSVNVTKSAGNCGFSQI